MPGEIDAELDQLIAKYGIKAVMTAAQARAAAPPAAPPAPPAKKVRKPARKKRPKPPEPQYDPKTGMRLPTGVKVGEKVPSRTYGTTRLPPKKPSVVARPSAGGIETYMSRREQKKPSPDQIAEIVSEDINFNNGLIIEDCGVCGEPAKPKKKKNKKEEIVKEDDFDGFDGEPENNNEEPKKKEPESESYRAMASMGHWKDRLSGGFADGRHPAEFDTEQLVMGINVELQHTDDPYVACEIAMDHLAEIEDYYTRLAQMEEEAKGEPEPEDEGEPEEEMPFEDINRIADTMI